jgi:hypothetical protein
MLLRFTISGSDAMLRPKQSMQSNKEAVMYTGTMIEELIESVQRAEMHAEKASSFAWGRHFEQQNLSTHMRLHTLNQDLSYEHGRIGAA